MKQTLLYLSRIRRFPREIHLYITRGMLLALLIGAAAHTRELSASCGDYVVIGGKTTLHRMMHLPMGSENQVPEETIPPCRYGNCDSGPPATPIAPPIDPTQLKTRLDFAVLSDVGLGTTGIPLASISDASTALLSGYPERIDRPPR